MGSTLLLLLLASISYAASIDSNKNNTVFNPSIFIGDKEIKLDKYFRSQELEQLLRELKHDYADIMDSFPIGPDSKIWAVRITSKTGELKPKVKLVANIHGDETVGYALLVSLIQYLLYSYEVDNRIRRMLQKTDIYIIPTLNPGRLYCLKGMGVCPNPPESDDNPGYNASDVDLDREFFPEYYEYNKYGIYSRQPQNQTLHMIDFFKKNPFVLSANLKGGAIVANYPFDDFHRNYSKFHGSETPDNEFFVMLAKDYAQQNSMMKSGNACNEYFQDGITNGAHWKKAQAYKIYGGTSMQDANYIMSNCFEISLYLSCIKYPPATELPKYWYANLKSLLGFIESAHRGIFGYVKDSSGKTIRKAVVTVEGNINDFKTTPRGEYWRLLPAGSYNVTASAFPYVTEKKSVTLNDRKLSVKHDFVLTKANVYGPVKNYNDIVIPHANITIIKVYRSSKRSTPTYQIKKIIHVSNGHFCSKLDVGQYILIAQAYGYKKDKCQADIGSPSTSVVCIFKLGFIDSTLPSIYGYVKDIHGRPLKVQAVVELYLTPNQTKPVDTLVVDYTGEYSWRLEAGDYRLKAKASGYTTKVKDVYLNQSLVRVNFKLQPNVKKEKSLLKLLSKPLSRSMSLC